MANFWDRLDDIRNEIFDVAKKTYDKTKEVSKIGLKRLDQQVKHTDLQRIYSKLGQIVHQRLENQEEVVLRKDDADTKPLFDEILVIESELDTIGLAIEELKNK